MPDFSGIFAHINFAWDQVLKVSVTGIRMASRIFKLV